MENKSLREIEAEIKRLLESPYVALAREEQAIRFRRERVLEDLKQQEKRGMELAEEGMTLEYLSEFRFGTENYG